ncbi:alpha-1,4-N-acetylglucosaminyltransferase-like [Carcharodon carcharias]|uniref:alpha-1,4-N-acetylglucosaminyltransferase-like n=1 Tax=Carcharodon carcharias TaxID=13397 RepID=UPI001B7F0B0D|nr:alpha-1,4-N-acetylglucosaminyltransferase-like [Carcharodon carcharias]
MGSRYKWFLLMLAITVCAVLYRFSKMNTYQSVRNDILEIIQLRTESERNVPKRIMEPGIMFVETSDKVEPTPLAACSVESAARLHPDKRVYFFMKGFNGKLSQYPQPNYTGIPLLSAISNVVLLPLNLTELFENTPLHEWHQKVNPDLEMYWLHVLADGCRLALLWKYSGVYLDTDIISMKSLPFINFTALEDGNFFNNGAMGFNVKHHPFMLECMKDFVANYTGHIWGYQGPKLITRVLKRWCKFDKAADASGKECNEISLLIPSRFYPIHYSSWGRYYDPWKKENAVSVFSGSYGTHVWNYMNSERKRKIIAGSGSLIEYLFQLYCPTTYRNFIQSPKSSKSFRA